LVSSQRDQEAPANEIAKKEGDDECGSVGLPDIDRDALCRHRPEHRAQGEIEKAGEPASSLIGCGGAAVTNETAAETILKAGVA
jgi:hypothetical protein